jgi:F-type H+-transporting ATPase subunit epsilon
VGNMDVSVVSPETEVFRGEADMVIARSPEGEFAILRNHIPFLAALVPSRVSIIEGNERSEFFVPGGFLEASRIRTGSESSPDADGAVGSHDRYHVIMLADDAEPIGDIDIAEARRRFDEAERRRSEEADERAEAEMRIALARVEIAESRGQ